MSLLNVNDCSQLVMSFPFFIISRQLLIVQTHLSHILIHSPSIFFLVLPLPLHLYRYTFTASLFCYIRLSLSYFHTNSHFFYLSSPVHIFFNIWDFDCFLGILKDYRFRLQDRGFPPRISNTTVHIIVIDNDDLPPKFTQDVYRTQIPEFYPILVSGQSYREFKTRFKKLYSYFNRHTDDFTPISTVQRLYIIDDLYRLQCNKIQISKFKLTPLLLKRNSLSLLMFDSVQ